MTVYDLYMTLANAYCMTPVAVYDKHGNILTDVENWGCLVEHYSKSLVLFFNYELGEITLDKIRRE